jgi:glutathione peroxidase
LAKHQQQTVFVHLWQSVSIYRPMKTALLILAMGVMVMTSFAANHAYEFQMKGIDGKPVALSSYEGKVTLMVNVASKCGYTPQYEGLEALYRKYEGKGLVVLGFPANNFGSQEPGTDAEIATFCKRTYDVSFPMFSKISVKGQDQAPLYQYLTSPAANSQTAGDVRWNFTKFLVGKDGKVIARFESKVAPNSPELIQAIEAALR